MVENAAWRSAIESDPVQLALVLEGRSVQGRISVDYLSVLAKEMQTTLRRLAANKQGKPGRYTRDVEQACTLELVGFRPGSVALDFALVPLAQDQEALWRDAGRESMDKLLELFDAGESGVAGWSDGLHAQVLDGLDRMTRPLDDGLDSITLSVRGGGVAHRSVRVTKSFRQRIRPAATTEAGPEMVRVVGVIWEADWKRHTAELHEADGRVVEVRFDADRDEEITEARRRKVVVTGVAGGGQGRRRVVELRRLELLDESEAGPDEGAFGFWDAPTLDELAERQGVRGAAEIDELAGDWPEDEDLDAFLDMVREGRG